MAFMRHKGTMYGNESFNLDKPLPVYRTYIGRISCYFEFIYNEYLKLLSFVREPFKNVLANFVR